MIFVYLLLAWVVSFVFPIRDIDSYEAFASSRDASWGHIVNNGLGPVWVGEFGSDKQNAMWNWTILYLKERDLDFAYWSIDGEHFPSMAAEFGEHVSGLTQEETYGLWDTNYATIRHLWKLRDLQSLMDPDTRALSAQSGASVKHVRGDATEL